MFAKVILACVLSDKIAAEAKKDCLSPANRIPTEKVLELEGEEGKRLFSHLRRCFIA